MIPDIKNGQAQPQDPQNCPIVLPEKNCARRHFVHDVLDITLHDLSQLVNKPKMLDTASCIEFLPIEGPDS